MRYVLGIDFDGVIHRYGRGDQGAEIYDMPTHGAAEALAEYVKHFDVYIVSSRASTEGGVIAIKRWMADNNLPELPVSNQKPPGELLVMIDDRGWRFNGEFPSLEDLMQFKPWWDKACA